MPEQNRPGQPPERPAAAPRVIDLEQIEAEPGFGSLTEATVKFETPEARHARERRETTDKAHEYTLSLLRLSLAGFLLVGFFALGVYLFAVKTDATETQKLYATTVLTAIASGGAGYTFGKKEDKKD